MSAPGQGLTTALRRFGGRAARGTRSRSAALGRVISFSEKQPLLVDHSRDKALIPDLLSLTNPLLFPSSECPVSQNLPDLWHEPVQAGKKRCQVAGGVSNGGNSVSSCQAVQQHALVGKEKGWLLCHETEGDLVV